MSLRITKRQTTYWDFSGPDGTTRVLFFEKKEFSFVSPLCDTFEVVSDHPVLVDYREAWTDIYMTSPHNRPEALLEDLTGAVTSVVGPWRRPTAYFNALSDPLLLLRGGFGLLASAPQPVAEQMGVALDKWEAAYTTLSSRSPAWPMQALVAGPNVVVARGFRVERVW